MDGWLRLTDGKIVKKTQTNKKKQANPQNIILYEEKVMLKKKKEIPTPKKNILLKTKKY